MSKGVAVFVVASALLCIFVNAYPQTSDQNPCGPPPNGPRPNGPPPSGPPPNGSGRCGPPNGGQHRGPPPNSTTEASTG